MTASPCSRLILVHVATHARDDDVLRGADAIDLFGVARGEVVKLEGTELQAVEAVHRIEVDWHRQQRAIDAG